jgi:hypothetical protein
MIQNPSDTNYGTEVDEYKGPEGGGTSLQEGYRTTADHATAFQTQHLSKQYGKPLPSSKQTRGGIFQWATTPSFNSQG